MGPMRAAARFVANLQSQQLLPNVQEVKVDLYGSLALTGEGHQTPAAIVYGLLGLDAESMDLNRDFVAETRQHKQIRLAGQHAIPFDIQQDIILQKDTFLPQHANAMRFRTLDTQGAHVADEVYFSIGGGAIRRADEIDAPPQLPRSVPYEFNSCNELVSLCRQHKISIAELVRRNEAALYPAPLLKARLHRIIAAMQQAIERGISTGGILPGELKLTRRAPLIYQRLEDQFHRNATDALTIIDWINLWAFAVAEENAAGGRVVTAPTMGSAGVLPAVLRYYERYGCKEGPTDADTGMETFLLTASAICSLYRANASISGAEVGCQGEVGVACSMAAAGLTAAMGGTIAQIENAAEIAMEHNLGLTCDPICGLVQVPCIERNAIGAVKAVNAARLAMRGDGSHFVSLDSVIATMDETGRALQSGYRETALAGLARNAFTC